jgi:hypothetical protein
MIRLDATATAGHPQGAVNKSMPSDLIWGWRPVLRPTALK